MFKIDNDIPMPHPSRRWGFVADMKVGESFFVPETEMKHGTAVAGARLALRPGQKVTYRQREEEGIKGVRIWMIKDDPRKRS